MKLNKNIALLPDDYIFAAVRKKAETFARTSGTKLVDLGVGDVKLPLFTATVDAMKKACDELGKKETFRGYPPAEGYMFLREKTSETRRSDFSRRNLHNRRSERRIGVGLRTVRARN